MHLYEEPELTERIKKREEAGFEPTISLSRGKCYNYHSPNYLWLCGHSKSVKVVRVLGRCYNGFQLKLATIFIVVFLEII